MKSLLVVLLAAPAGAMSMPGMYGPYPMTREATGTSWQPESTPHEGLHERAGDWTIMAHADAALVFDGQGGPRGDSKLFPTGMAMGDAWRRLGPGTLGLRTMFSPDPVMGSFGYPELLQTGETGDGVRPLVDRQHPHDFIMELAATYSVPLDGRSSAFVYAGLPGEPALGPTAFMHRFSGMEIPEAPITHHWLDSTHVAEGVVTGGLARGDWKLELSSFRGREPDQDRWDVDRPKLDSWSTRVSWNPTRDWALQASYCAIRSPEQLEPDVNQDRFTMSASWNARWSSEAFGQTTLAYGRVMNKPGRDLDALLLESSVRVRERHTLMARVERVVKDELSAPGSWTVGKLSAGYLYDFAQWKRTRWGVGGLLSAYALPPGLHAAYDPFPISYMMFLRGKLR